MPQEILAHASIRSITRVREDPELYIPDYLSAGPAGIRPDAWSAANRKAADLRDAERYLDEAQNLVAVLRAALQEDADARTMQAETVLKIIEDRVEKAHSCIDRHDTGFMNLFLAYFDLQDRAPPSDRE